MKCCKAIATECEFIGAKPRTPLFFILDFIGAKYKRHIPAGVKPLTNERDQYVYRVTSCPNFQPGPIQKKIGSYYKNAL